MERNKQNTKNLDNIIFYSGQYSQDAAEYTVNRQFSSEVNGLGTLSKDQDGYIYWSSFPNVRYKERDVILNSIGDLYNEAFAYATEFKPDFNENAVEIKNNRYTTEYSYQIDLNNTFGLANIYVKNDLKDFLLSLNEQTFNKGAFYGDNYEVSSIKIDQTYYNWFPQNTVAYYETIDASYNMTYTYYYLNDNEYNSMPVPEITEDLPEDLVNIINQMEEGQYLHSYSYDYVQTYTYQVPYIIGGDYYSYVRKKYDTIDSALSSKIEEGLSDFEERYNHDESIYSYYMYDCNFDIQMLLSTLNLGVKQSTFKFGFNSIYDGWFGNTINVKLNLNSNNGLLNQVYNEGIPDTDNEDFTPMFTLANITSGYDDAIFSIFANNTERISGSNIRLNSFKNHTFSTNRALTDEDTVNILTPYYINTLDLSPITNCIDSVLNLNETNWILRDCMLKNLILGSNDKNSSIEKIFGLNDIQTLEYINLKNVNNLTSTPAIDKLENLKVFDAENSNIDSFRPKSGTKLYYVSLPSTIKSIKLIRNTFKKGILNILNEERFFNGTFNYTPTSDLVSLTLNEVDSKLSYKLVSDWYNVLKTENKLDSVIYLEMKDIDWENVPIDMVKGIKNFDINPNLSGTISVIGNGNYGWLSRKDYQDLKKLYGINALIQGNVNNKIFKDLDIIAKSNKETFEFSFKVKNKNIEAFNARQDEIEAAMTPEELRAYELRGERPIRFNDTLDVAFKEYAFNINTKDYDIDDDPYKNVAANSFLDLLYIDGEKTYTFVNDTIEGYVYTKLSKSIDTFDSTEVKKMKVGDIALFNGDTLMIFYKESTKTHHLIKLGNITDISVLNRFGNNESTILNWFKDNETELEFILSQRENVIQNYTITSLSEDGNILYNTNDDGLILSVDIDTNAKEHYNDIIEKRYTLVYDNTLLNVTDITGENSENTYPKKYSVKLKPSVNVNETINTSFGIYCNANQTDTLETFNIQIRSLMINSSVEEGTLVLDSNVFSIDGNTLLISSTADPEYVDGIRTLIIR